MDEQNLNQTAPQESEAGQAEDLFLNGFGDEDAATEHEAGQAEEQDARDTEEHPTDPTADREEAVADGQPAEQAQQEPTKEYSWNFRHMDEERTMTPADITPELLQRGLDYERIRSKYDEAKPVIEMMRQFAQKSGMSMAEYVRHIRTAAKKSDGMTDAEAQRHLDLEDREAAVSAKEAEQKAKADAKKAQEDRVRADLADFAKAFPEDYAKAKSDPKTIPSHVWDEVNSGRSTLTAAYAKHLVAQAQAAAAAEAEKAKTAAQNAKNDLRSTGSMKSAGNSKHVKDPFEEGFGL